MKKFIALLLSFIMVLTLLPSTVGPTVKAEGGAPDPPPGYVPLETDGPFEMTDVQDEDGHPHTVSYDLYVNYAKKGIFTIEYIDGEYSGKYAEYVMPVPYLSYDDHVKEWECTYTTLVGDPGYEFGDMDPSDLITDTDICNGSNINGSLRMPGVSGATNESCIGTIDEETRTVDGQELKLPKAKVYRTAEFLGWGTYDSPKVVAKDVWASMAFAVASGVLVFLNGEAVLAIGATLGVFAAGLKIAQGIVQLISPSEEGWGGRGTNLIKYKYRYRIVIDDSVEYLFEKVVTYDHISRVEGEPPINYEYFHRNSITYTSVPEHPIGPDGLVHPNVNMLWHLTMVCDYQGGVTLWDGYPLYTYPPETEMLNSVVKPLRVAYCANGYHKEIDSDNDGYCDYCGEECPLSTPELTATPASYNSIELSWTPVEGATGYELSWCDEEQGTYYNKLIIPDPETTSHTHTNLVPYKPQYYKVRAYVEKLGYPTKYSMSSIVVSAIPTLKKPAFHAESGGYNSIDLEWDPVPGASGYEVFYSNDPIGTYYTVCDVKASDTPSTSFTHHELQNGDPLMIDRTYYYKMRAYYTKLDDTKEYSMYSNILSAAPKLEEPNLRVSTRYNQVTLEWDPVDGADRYCIDSLNSETGLYEYFDDILGTSRPITGLTTGDTYDYRVRARITIDLTDHYSDFSYISAVPVLAKPTIDRAISTDYNSILLSWQPVEDATDYEVWYSDGDSPIDTVTSTSFTDTGLAFGADYYYKIRAHVDSDDVYSEFSDIVSAATALRKPTLINAVSEGYDSISLLWSEVAGADGYEISLSGSETGTYLPETDIDDPGTLSHTYTGLTTGTTYYYKVRAYRMAGDSKVYSNYSNFDYATPTLVKPSLNSVVSACPNSLRLEWSSVPGASGYEVLDYNIGAGTLTSNCYVTDTSCLINGLTTGTTYSYKIRAYRTVGSSEVYSGNSNYKSAAPSSSTPHDFAWIPVEIWGGSPYLFIGYGHEQRCTICGLVQNRGLHEYDNCEDTDCNICEMTRTAPGHTYGDWTYYSTHLHQRVCSECGAVDYSNHVYPSIWINYSSTQHRHACTECGHYAYANHTFGPWAAISAYQHRHVCSACGYVQDASHTYTNCADATCNDCGYSRGSVSGILYSDGHVYSSCTDTTCNRCGHSRTALSHTYTSVWVKIHTSSICRKRVRTCSVCGYSYYYYDYSHSNYSSWSYYSSTKHKRKCGDCGYTQYASHSWTYLGNNIYKCTGCGAYKYG
jgi:fibronectin type 3 domain-containing protein